MYNKLMKCTFNTHIPTFNVTTDFWSYFLFLKWLFYFQYALPSWSFESASAIKDNFYIHTEKRCV